MTPPLVKFCSYSDFNCDVFSINRHAELEEILKCRVERSCSFDSTLITTGSLQDNSVLKSNQVFSLENSNALEKTPIIVELSGLESSSEMWKDICLDGFLHGLIRNWQNVKDVTQNNTIKEAIDILGLQQISYKHVFAFQDNYYGVHLFVGVTKGSLVKPSIRTSEWSAMFQPVGADKPLGKMSHKEKMSFSPMNKSLEMLSCFLQNNSTSCRSLEEPREDGSHYMYQCLSD